MQKVLVMDGSKQYFMEVYLNLPYDPNFKLMDLMHDDTFLLKRVYVEPFTLFICDTFNNRNGPFITKNELIKT